MIDLKLCNSNGEAKRLIGQDAVKINKEIIKNKEFMINEKSFIKEASQKNQYIVVFVGKKKIWSSRASHLKVFDEIWYKNRNRVI